MLQRLFKTLGKSLEQRPDGASPADEEQQRRLACAALLLECMRADFEHHETEAGTLRSLLASHFGLSDAQVEALIEHAGVELKQSVSLHGFVQQINRSQSPQDKRALIGLLWQLAYADGRLDAHEEHLLRKLADLLHVPHRDYIAAKLDAAAAAGNG